MIEFKMPELPEPAFNLHWKTGEARYTVSKPNVGDTAVYTAAQMDEHARLVAQQMREACAKECDAEAAKTRISDRDNRQAIVAQEWCAAAIRSIQVGGEHGK